MHPPRRIDQLLSPFRTLLHDSRAGSLLLIGATLAALVWANGPWAAAYDALWAHPISVGAGGWSLTLPLRGWINDGLMTVFFLVVGLEIERELLVGTLRGLRAAALPIAAAVGGMLVPALIYVLFAGGTPEAGGWGIPMATDIAFALGLLGLLAPGAPVAVRAFLAALAIVDDLGAILVIAVAYGAEGHPGALPMAALCTGVLAALRFLGVRSVAPYVLAALPLWYFLHEGGIHPSLTGVVLAFAIPPRTRKDATQLLDDADRIMDQLRARRGTLGTAYDDANVQSALEELGQAYAEAQSPSLRTERALHGWVSLGILPIFALANAGVRVGEALGPATPVAAMLGIVGGLVIGKPVGIVLATWLAVRTGVATLPEGLRWPQVIVVGCLGGIGFTMAIFVTSLAFPDPAVAAAAKGAVLAASVTAALLAALMVRRAVTPAATASAGATG